MKRYSVFLIMLAQFAFLNAQNEKQVLVFRHSGEVNLLYADDLDSIILSNIDTLGVDHEDYVSQVFYLKDTLFRIPIADIDSVAFGNRNKAELKSDVKQLTDEDIAWIIRVEGNTIYYKTTTPENILPQIGQKLYYPIADDLFPYGLAAQVVNITNSQSEIAVEVKRVDLTELFDELFYAGSMQQQVMPSDKKYAPGNISSNFDLSTDFNLGEYGTISYGGGLSLTGNVVIAPFRNYYHGEFDMSTNVDFDVALTTKNSTSYEWSEDIFSKKLPPIYSVLFPTITFSAFANIEAELRLGYSMHRSWNRKIVWTRQNGDNSVTYPDVPQNENDVNEAKIDVTVDGRLFFGPRFDLDLHIIGDVAGVRARVAVGPEIKGQLSMGLLTDISREYNASIYGAANLHFNARAELGAYFLSRENIILGEEQSTPLFTYSLSYNSYEIELFPRYSRTRASRQFGNNRTSISVATMTDNQIANDVETGFEVLDISNNVIDSLFVGAIIADTTKRQIYSTEIVLKNGVSHTDSIFVRPVFHYAGYTIPHAKTHVMMNPSILPITSYMTNGYMSVISGASIIGQAKGDSTTLHIGNYLPIPNLDTTYVKRNPFIGPLPITTLGTMSVSLVGEWAGIIDQQETLITFYEDLTGMFTQKDNRSFTYQLNTPQIGDILFLFDNETARTLTVTSLSVSEMILRDKKNNKTITLTKIN